MALKDTLLTLTDSSKNSLFCKFGKIYIDLDEETRGALESALKSGASTMDICRALNDDGFTLEENSSGKKEDVLLTHQHRVAWVLNETESRNDHKETEVEHSQACRDSKKE